MQAPATYQPRRVVTNWPPPRAAEAAAAGGAVASPFDLPLAQVAREAAAAAAARAGGDAGAGAAAADAMEGVEGDKAAPAVDVTKHNFEASALWSRGCVFKGVEATPCITRVRSRLPQG